MCTCMLHIFDSISLEPMGYSIRMALYERIEWCRVNTWIVSYTSLKVV